MSSPRDDDPFDCFDGDDESNTEIAQDADGLYQSARVPKRHAECGVLAFHAGTERALLTHVENQLALTDKESTSESVLQAIDEFCVERHWMMHVGNEKSAVIANFLNQCLASRETPLTVVELGTYCGYSAVRLGQTLQQAHCPDCHIYTVEINPQYAAIAQRLIRLAKLDKLITILLLDDAESDLVSLLKSKLGDKTIGFLFLDHDKDVYLADLQKLERTMIVRGTHVAADNITFSQIDNYRIYVKALSAQGIVDTKLVETQLEYSEPDANEFNRDALRDGIGESSIFVCSDPMCSNEHFLFVPTLRIS
jgi:catechol O-methyltransferase